MAKALFPLRNHTAYTHRWKAEGTGVVVIRSDSFVSKIQTSNQVRSIALSGQELTYQKIQPSLENLAQKLVA